MTLNVGMYVRVPIFQDDLDRKLPRSFVMGQVSKIDPVSEVVSVRLHDIYKTGAFYGELFNMPEELFERDLIHCKIPKGSQVKTPFGVGEVLFGFREKGSLFYKYHVRLEGEGLHTLLENELKADFTAFDLDPAEMLIRYEFQNPSWFASRQVVSSTLHALNNAVYGFRELAGCRVYLLPHQVVTIVRCLENRPVRYMLADEVGLGKTIEACGIVKIMETRKASLRVLYVVPAPLIDQWKFELSSKFAIDAVVYQKDFLARHLLITPEDLLELSSSNFNRIDLLIVDETHHILKNELLYKAIGLLSRRTENVLLLSATPIQDRREEFLRLLSLLEPTKYGAMSLHHFSNLVDKQQEIQRYLYLLTMNITSSYDDFAEEIRMQVSELATLLDDPFLKEIVAQLEKGALDGEDLARRAAAYVSEHFRLERHIIRNRREALVVQGKIAQRALVERRYVMGGLEEFYGEFDAINALIEWLDEVNDHSMPFTIDVISPLLQAAFSSPWALTSQIEMMTRRGIVLPSSVSSMVYRWAEAANRELQRVDYLLDSNPDEIHGRLLHCLDYLEQETPLLSDDRSFKVLVFTHYKETAEKFYQVATRRLGVPVCRAFYHGMEREALQESADAFQSDPTCRILVCDETGGEGRNFQMADIVVHLDTPWNINTVEQRIGRLDRLGRSPDLAVTSVVFIAEGTVEDQLMHLWRDGLKVYQKSLSGLEIATNDITRAIERALRDDVREGLWNVLPTIAEEAQRMRDVVEEEEACELASMLYRPLTQTVERMLEVYQGKEDNVFSQAMLSWAGQSGFWQDGEPQSVLVEFDREAFSKRAAVNALIVPPAWEQYNVNPLVRRRGKIVGTFSRKTAIDREDILFYAPGDPIFDTVTRNALTSYRGRVTAVEIDNGPFNFAGLVFVWNVDPDITPIVQAELDPIALAEFRAYLPMEQIVNFYPVQPVYASIPVEEILALLRKRHVIRKARYLGRRQGSQKGPAELGKFIKMYPSHEWGEWVREARKVCRKQARNEVNDQWDYSTAVEEAHRIVMADSVSQRFFNQKPVNDDYVRRTYTAVLEALKNFRVELDSAIYLRVRNHDEHS